MTSLQVSDLAAFARQFRFTGGRLTALRLRLTRGEVRLQARVRAHASGKSLGDTPRPVRLLLELDGVEEYRLQKRLSAAVGKMTDLRLGYFQGLFFVNFDAWGLGPGEVPALHDFRASEVYAAGRSLAWQEIPRRKA